MQSDDRNPAIGELVDALKSVRSEHGKDTLAAVIGALEAVLRFGKTNDIDANDLAPLTRLLTALNDLKRGARPALLKPRVFKSHISTRAHEMQKARITLAIELYRRATAAAPKRAKSTIEEACKWVARCLRHSGYRFPSSNVSDWKVARQWRKEIHGATEQDKIWPARQHYDVTMARVDELLADVDAGRQHEALLLLAETTIHSDHVESG